MSLSWSRLTALSAVLTLAIAVPAFAQVTFSATTYNGGGQTISAGDVNGDGFKDLWVVDGNNFSSNLFLNDGTGHFTGPFSTAGGFFPRTGKMADLNGDGKLDLLGPDGDRVWVRLGNGDGSFGSPSNYTDHGGDQLAGVVDCNGDGILDALTAGGASGSPQNIGCLPGNGAGGFGVAISSPGTAFNLRDAQSGDINGDGFPDIAGLDINSATNLIVWLNNGSGVFTQSTFAGIGTGARKLAVGDVNGDGFADVIVTTSTNVGTGSILVYFGNSSGTLSQNGSYAAGKSIWGVSLADMDLDGNLDVLLGQGGGGASTNGVAVWLNNGHGVFTAGSNNNLPSHFPEGLVAGLFNSDPAPDIAASGGGSFTSVLLQTGTPPVANAGADYSISTDLTGAATVTLDASASTGSGAKTFEWKEGSNVIGTSAIVTPIETGFGAHTFTVKVSNMFGSSSDSVVVTLLIPTSSGPQGATGPTGPQGPMGPQGPKGDKGDKGDTGATGAAGANGATGAQGNTGAQGPQGVAGAQGAQGNTGAQGPQGVKGDKGDTGATGAPGANGANGATGAQGDKGDKGDTGATGAAGANGANGATGAQGDKGDKGDKGDTGATGAAGANGATGAQGDKGDKGDKGDTGATGAAGANGATGAQGDKGDKGDKGDTGATGAQGPIGPQGPAGQDATVPSGAVILMDASLPAPVGYTLIGTFNLPSGNGNGNGNGNSVQMKVYRKN